jgi:hypothetical protein
MAGSPSFCGMKLFGGLHGETVLAKSLRCPPPIVGYLSQPLGGFDRSQPMHVAAKFRPSRQSVEGGIVSAPDMSKCTIIIKTSDGIVRPGTDR